MCVGFVGAMIWSVLSLTVCVFVGAMIRSVISLCVCWVCWYYDQECTLSHCVCVGFVGVMIRSELSLTVGLLVL